jgi:hypothetical protein
MASNSRLIRYGTNTLTAIGGFFVVILVIGGIVTAIDGKHTVASPTLQKVAPDEGGIPDIDLSIACRLPGNSADKQLATDYLRRCSDLHNSAKSSLAKETIAPSLMSFCSAGARIHQGGYIDLANCIHDEQGRPRLNEVRNTLRGTCGKLPDSFDRAAYKECELLQATAELHLIENPGALRFSSQVDSCLAKTVAEEPNIYRGFNDFNGCLIDQANK